MHPPEDGKKHKTRRNFLGQALTAAGVAIAAPSLLNQTTAAQTEKSASTSGQGEVSIALNINGK